MTEPMPARGSSESFDAAVQPEAVGPTLCVSASLIRHKRWMLPAATVVLGVLGVLGVTALAAAALGPGIAPSPVVTTPGAIERSSPTRSPSAVQPTPAPTAAAAGRSSTLTVAERPDPGWVISLAKATNIPQRALTAYAGAALTVADTNPECGLGWNTLAAIGQVESGHGTINGAHIQSNGTTAPAIVGIPLSGDGVAEVSDTDQGRLDGDATWDRAVGPMQFIPGTWAKHAKDGDGDGITDINQIDDAALAAAVYLCAVGGDLKQPANWIAAIDAYNPTLEYNNRVADDANAYADLAD